METKGTMSNLGPRLVEFRLFWKGGTKCKTWPDREIGYLEFFFNQVTPRIKAPICLAKNLKHKIVEIPYKEISSYWDYLVFGDGNTIFCSYEIAKMIKIQARIFETYKSKNRNIFYRNLIEPYSNNPNSEKCEMEYLPISFIEPPDIQGGKCYNVYIEHKKNESDKITVSIKLTGNSQEKNISFQDLMKETTANYRIMLGNDINVNSGWKEKEQNFQSVLNCTMDMLLIRKWLIAFSSEDFIRFQKESDEFQTPMNQEQTRIFKTLKCALPYLTRTKSLLENLEPVLRHLELGQIALADQQIETFDNKGKKYVALLFIARAFIKKDSLNEAKTILNKIPNHINGKNELVKRYHNKVAQAEQKLLPKEESNKKPLTNKEECIVS